MAPPVQPERGLSFRRRHRLNDGHHLTARRVVLRDGSLPISEDWEPCSRRAGPTFRIPVRHRCSGFWSTWPSRWGSPPPSVCLPPCVYQRAAVLRVSSCSPTFDTVLGRVESGLPRELVNVLSIFAVITQSCGLRPSTV